jgi:hypothetical protein
VVAAVVVVHDDERGIAFLGEPGEPDGDGARDGRRVVEHDQPERVAAQEEVGAPGAPVAGGRADDPEASRRREGCPVGGGQGARGVDVCNPSFVTDGAGDEEPGERGGAAAAAAGDLGEPAAGDAARREHRVERRDAGRDRVVHRRGRSDDGGDLVAKCGEGGHGKR